MLTATATRRILASSRVRLFSSAPGQQHLPDPAEGEEGILEKVQDVLRPSWNKGRAYHYAESSARAVLREQEACCAQGATLESMQASPGAVGDEITAPKSWHFSNRSDQMDEQRKDELVEQSNAQKDEAAKG